MTYPNKTGGIAFCLAACCICRFLRHFGSLQGKKSPNRRFVDVLCAKRNKLLAGILGFLVIPAIFAMDWASTDAGIIANFGGNNSGIPYSGTVFEGEGPVRASGAGEVIFFDNPGNSASRIPSPLGAWIAIDHGDGLISLYSHLETPPSVPVPDHPEQGRVIAEAGQSGWSDRQGFSFAFFDRKERRWINPSMIIAPPLDAVEPVIHSVELIGADGRVFNPGVTRNINQGRYTLSVHATDVIFSPPGNTGGAASGSRTTPSLAPYRILCSVNGQETGVLSFETYAARDGTLMVPRNGLVPARQVYARYPAFEVGDLWFTRGQATLEIIVQDILRNSRSVIFRIQVD
jgi:hypothetical protein